jgi:asparagine N-glycosylation enzyme membrane subunit Stt3
MLFAIITGAHFFPYGWFYNAKPYYVMAPIISFFIMLLGLYLDGENLWLEPLSMVVLLLFLILMIHLDYKRKVI